MEDNFSLKKLAKKVTKKVVTVAKKPVQIVAKKTGKKVVIPKKLGRINPDFIKTDQFDFAKLMSTVETIGNAAQTVSTTYSQVATAANTVKATVKTPPASTSPLSNAGYTPLQNTNPYVNNGYNVNTPVTGQPPLVLQPESSIDTNTMLMFGGGLLVMVILTFVLRPK